MPRYPIELTEEQAQVLEALACERGCSIAGLIRQSIDDLIQRTEEHTRVEKRRRAISATGRFRSGQTDISETHDETLLVAYSS